MQIVDTKQDGFSSLKSISKMYPLFMLIEKFYLNAV